MRIATWNVNSIKAHLDSVSAWLTAEKPDVVCLQEIKCEDQAFPAAHFEDLGYQATVHGQKTYNGVALLSRLPMEDVQRGLPGDASDEQARFIAATVIEGSKAVRVCGLYLPNGNPAPGPKYDYKLGWMKRLQEFARAELLKEEAFVLAGDYNVIPEARDARNPQNWVGDALYLPATREAFRTLLALGLTESFRALHPSMVEYSFWDYQAGAWPKNNGIRIDHLLLSPQAADRLVSAEIHKTVRGDEKPSDHVPVMIELG
ncbi:MAG: exodeoxyribonuclease III [Alphaproteobacteria bacterium]|nr:exodeoxyribonuclease III [Alphaproteobacteria bacterium]